MLGGLDLGVFDCLLGGCLCVLALCLVGFPGKYLVILWFDLRDVMVACLALNCISGLLIDIQALMLLVVS